MTDKCENCAFSDYDEDEQLVCNAGLDEDDMVRFLSGRTDVCPCWRPDDEYRTALKQ